MSSFSIFIPVDVQPAGGITEGARTPSAFYSVELKKLTVIKSFNPVE